MKRPTRLPSVPPIQLTGGRVSIAVRWRYFRADLAQFLDRLARRVAGH